MMMMMGKAATSARPPLMLVLVGIERQQASNNEARSDHGMRGRRWRGAANALLSKLHDEAA